jgi:hypothetical protein
LACNEQRAVSAGDDAHDQCQHEVVDSRPAEGVQGKESKQYGQAGIDRPGYGLSDAHIDPGGEIEAAFYNFALSKAVEDHNDIVNAKADYSQYCDDEHRVNFYPEYGENGQHYEDILQ